MDPELLTFGEQLVGLFVFAFGGFALGFYPGRRGRRERTRALELAVAQFERRAVDAQRANEDLWERTERAEAAVRGLQLSIVQIPEIAQRLSGLRELREIPDSTLDLVQEIFQCSYSVFYRVSNGKLVAVACRGESEFRPGHRLEPGEGIVGWTAVKQLPFTPEDAELESGGVRSRNLARCTPRRGFSLCVPIMSQERPLGVILVGPSLRQLPHAREIGRTIALIASVAIASTQVLTKERLLAKTDGLTGLINKTNVYKRLRDLISEDNAQMPRISVFLLDIDHFKQYNDSNGHLDGDELLKRMGALLRENSRENEVVGRYGGEEFLVVMPGTSKETALRVAERIRTLVESMPFEHADGQPTGRVTISGGVATWPSDGDDVDSLLRNADAALYEAKRAGRYRVLAFSAPELATAGADDGYLAAAEDAEVEKREGRDGV
jgi:diguanylate cyclase (GGDEF)-like protein